MSKKLFSIIAGIALMLSVSVVSVAQAATLTPGQINAIVVMLQSFGVDAQTVANVTASLNGTPVVTNPVVVATTFTKDLQVGSKGADVTALQNMLGVTPATGYFGPKTKAAVIKYQLEKGITPAFGYFGPKTRAIANGPITPVVVEVIPGTDLVVSLAATSPVGTALIIGQVAANLAEFTFTNKTATPAIVTNITLQRMGVSGDSLLSDVYLYNGAVRLTDSASVSSSKITFNAGTGIFTVPAGASMTISVKANINPLGTGGQLVAVALTGVTASVPVLATYPVSGASMSTFNPTDIATVSLALTSVSTSVDAGTLNQTIWGSTLTQTIRAVYLKSLAVKIIGSVPQDSLQNVKLFVSGIQVATATGMDANSIITFDLTLAPYKIDGNRNLEIRADIVNGANRNFSVSLQNKADILVIDSNYNVGLSVIGTIPMATNLITVNAGSLSASLDTTLGSGDVVLGSTGVSLAKYTFKGYGENVKVSSLKIGVSQDLTNVTLYANGASISSSQNIDSVTPVTFSFGSSLIINAGQTVAFEVKGDLKNAAGVNLATSSSVSVTLMSVANNAQGSYSSNITTFPSASIEGPTMTVVGGSLTVSKSSTYNDQTLTSNTNGFKIGSFMLGTNASEAVRVTGLRVALGGTLGLTSLSNLYTSVNSTKVNPQALNNFGTDFTIPANSSQTVDIFADVGALTSLTTIRAATGTITMGNYFDSGSIATTTINGQLFTAGSYLASTTAAVMATRLANEINGSTTAPVTASVIGAVITVTAKTTVANYATLYGNNVTFTAGKTGTGTVIASGTGTLKDGALITTTGSTIITTLAVTATGVLSNIDASQVAQTGQTLTVGSGTLSTPTLVVGNSSPTNRFVQGGTTGNTIATFNFKSSVGPSVIKELSFVTDPMSSPAITKITVGGVSKDVSSGTTTVSGLNIIVPLSVVGIDVPVTVSYAKVSALGGGIPSNVPVKLILGTVKYDSGSVSNTRLNVAVSSNTMYPVAGMPTISIVDSSQPLVNGSREIANLAFTVIGSSIRIKEIPIKLSYGATATTTNVSIYDGNTEVGSTTVAMTPNGTGTIILNDGGLVLSGAQTFKLIATITGVATGVGTDSITIQLGTAASFKWDDIEGNAITTVGTYIPSYSTTDASVITN